MTTDTIKDRVRRGAMLLDAEVPGWAQRINLTRLNMAYCLGCVIGQTFGDYWKGCRQLRITARGAHSQAAAFGFHSSFDPPPFYGMTVTEWEAAEQAKPDEYTALRTAWLLEIRARLAPDDDDGEVPGIARQNCYAQACDVL